MSGRVYVRKFDHDEARRRRAAGETYASIASDLGVSVTAVQRVVSPEMAARMYRRTRERLLGICEECRGPTVNNPYNKSGRHDRNLCRTCAGKADRTNVNLTGGGRVVEVRCCTCGEWKNPDDFHRGARYRDLRPGGFHNYCRACATRLRRDYRNRHKVPCELCGAPRLAPTETGGKYRDCVDTGLCANCYRESRRKAAA